MSFIDERIVKMQFDNRQFEQGAQESMKTLDELDAKMNFDGSVKGLDRLRSITNNLDFGPMTGALDAVTGRFSALETIATGALLRIGGKIEAAGEKLLKAFTVDNISAGWEKFGNKTTSVATLVSQGNDLETVNKQLDRLNWFTDETSYNFVDMVQNIGKFTATGIELEPAVNAMEGIATWTALSGQNAATASRAMYQISQAMGSGVMRKEDYKSIQNASMDTEEFRQKALDAAVAMGTLRKNTDGTYTSIVEGAKESTFKIGQFADHLTAEQWFTKDVMMNVFGQYASAVDELYEAVDSGEFSTASEAIEAMGGNLDEFGLKAFKAAQEARTWGDVVDSVKDAVSTGWMNTFELIFGNYEEAKKLWTDLANELYGVFAESGNARNAMLKEWKELGGRDDILDAFWNIWYGVRSIMDMISEAFRDIFPATTAEQLKNFTERIKDFSEIFTNLFTDRSEKSKEGLSKQLLAAGKSAEEVDNIVNKVSRRIENFKNTFRGFFAAIDIVVQAFKAIAGGVKTLLGYIIPAGDGFLGFTGSIGESIVKFDEYIKENDVFGKAIEKLGPIFETVGGYISSFIEIVSSAAKKIWEFIKPILQTFGLFTDEGDDISDTSEKVSEAMDEVAEGAEKVSEKLSPLSKIFGFFEKVFGRVKELLEAASPIFSKIGKAISTLWDNIHNALVNGLKNFDAEGALDFFNGGIFAAVGFGIKNLIDKISKSAPSLEELAKKITGFLDTVKDAIGAWAKNQLAEMFMKIAIAVGVLAASLFVLSTVEPRRLYSAAIAILILAGALSYLMKSLSGLMNSGSETQGEGVLGKLKDTISSATGSKSTTDMVKASGAMIAMAAAVLILAFAVKSLADLEWTQLLKGLVGVAALLGMLIATTYALTKMKDTVAKGSLGLILFAIALGMLTGTVKKLSEISVEGLMKGVIALGAIMLELALFTKFSKDFKAGSGVGIVLLATSMLIFYSAMKKFGELDSAKLEQGTGALFSVLALLALFTRAIKSDGIIKTSLAMVIMGSSMLIFGAAIKFIGGLPIEQVIVGLAAIAVSMWMMYEVAQGLKDSIGAAGALLVMSIALIAFAAAMKILSTIEFEYLCASLLAIAGGLLILGLAGKYLAPFTTSILLLSAAFLIFSVATIALGAGITSISLGLIALSSAISTSLPIFIKGITRFFEAAIDACALLLPKIAELVVQLIIVVLVTLSEHLDDFVIAAVMVIDSFVRGIIAMIPVVIQLLADIVVAIINGLAQVIRDEAPVIFAAIGNLLDAIWDMIVELFAMIAEKIPIFGKGFADDVRSAKDWVIPEMQANAEDMANAYADSYNSTLDSRNIDISSTMQDTFGERISGLGDVGAEGAQDYLNGFLGQDFEGAGFEGVMDLTGGATDAFSSSGILSESYSFGSQVPEDITKGIEENSDAPAEAIGSMAEKAKTALDEFPKSSESAGKLIPVGMKNGMEAKANVPKNYASQIKNSVETNLRATGAYSIGSAIPEGMANGMAAKSYLVKDKATELSNMIPNTIKELLNINSPSKVVAAITESVPEGAAVGIKRTSYMVYDAMSDMSGEMLYSIKESVKNISDTVEDNLDVNPTITPILDLSQIQNGAYAANSILSSLNPTLRSAGGIVQVSRHTGVEDTLRSAVKDAVSDISSGFYGQFQDNSSYTIEVPVNIDGREVARITAPYTKSEIARIDRNIARRGGNV